MTRTQKYSATELRRQLNSPSIRALTIRQPWCWLILGGRKDWELRSWDTAYRGPLLLHAAKKVESLPQEDWEFLRLIDPTGPAISRATGAIVGVVSLERVAPFTPKILKSMFRKRAILGDNWIKGDELLLAFRLRTLVRLQKPVDCSGQLGLWRPTPDALRKVLGQL